MSERKQETFGRLESWQQELLEEYLCNESAKLKKIVRKLLLHLGGVTQKDEDDFISKSSYVLLKLLYKYDKTTNIPFNSYLESCLKKRFITWGLRDTNRLKRKNKIEVKDENGTSTYEILQDISIDAPIDGGYTLGDILVGDFNIDSEINKEIISDETEKYLNSLSDTQRMLARLIMENYSPSEIKEKLSITDNQYIKIINDMRTFEKSIILKQKKEIQFQEGKPLNKNNSQTFEKSKTDRLSISSIIKKINNHTIRFDHPLQRPSDQWTSAMQGNLISDILQGNPIPSLTFAEQIVNGFQIIWDLDGKQRCTNAYSFFVDGFKISKKIRRCNISYQVCLKDEDEKEILDENGVPKIEIKEFDIRDKKFSQLPEELKDKFTDYNFEIVQYINCSSEDIAYHIARYNEGKPMSVSHKGIIRLGEDFARMVKNISAMPFFKELGGYTVSEAKGTNGTLNRVVVESVMASNFLNEWKKNQEDMCDYMKDHATTEMFENFEDVVDRLSKVGTEKMFEQFDSKDSFLYFGLFARFVNTGLDDENFVEFMAEFSRSLHSKEICGVTYDSLCVNEDGKSTSNKDKTVAVEKINLLEKLMLGYLGINTEDIKSEEIRILDFVRENVDQNISKEDIEFYEELLNEENCGLKDSTFKVGVKHKILESENEPSLIAIVAYSIKNDIIIDGWFGDYFRRTNTYLNNQKENYIKMREDLEKYIQKTENKKSESSMNGGKLACAM